MRIAIFIGAAKYYRKSAMDEYASEQMSAIENLAHKAEYFANSSLIELLFGYEKMFVYICLRILLF